MSINGSWAQYRREQARNLALANGIAAQLRKEMGRRSTCLSCLRGLGLNKEDLCTTCAGLNSTTDGALLALLKPAFLVINPNPPLPIIKEAEPQGETKNAN